MNMISISIDQLHSSKIKNDQIPEIKEGDYVRLLVQDNGSGIKADVIESIFEPFFSTKASNKGTGLGLSVVHGIVKTHQGEITVESIENEGATFIVYLPVAATPASHLVESSSDPSSLIGSGHIACVDDEIDITVFVNETLQDFGYTLDCFSNANDFLAALKQEPEKYDLLITDLKMPKVSGLDLAKILKDQTWDKGILLITGFSQNKLNEDELKALNISATLKKPVTPEELAIAVKNTMAE